MNFDKCIRHVTNTTIKIYIISITPESSSCPFAVSFFPSPLALRNHWSAFLSRSMVFSRIWPASDMVFWAAIFDFQLPDTHIPSLDLASLMRPISPVMQPRSRKVCGMGWHQGDEGQEASPGRGRAFVCTWSNKDKSVISHFDLFKNQNICPHHVHCGCFKSAKAKFLVLSRWKLLTFMGHLPFYNAIWFHSLNYPFKGTGIKNVK